MTAFVLTVLSTAEARYDDSVETAVAKVGNDLGLAFSALGGGALIGAEADELAVDSQFAFEADADPDDEMFAIRVEKAVEKALAPSRAHVKHDNHGMDDL